MIRELPVTAVQEALHRRWRLLIPVYILLAIIVLIGIVGTILGLDPTVAAGAEPTRRITPTLLRSSNTARSVPSRIAEFRTASGAPYLRCFPRISPAAKTIRHLVFSTRTTPSGRQRELPIGISRRTYRDVDMVWFNCATCHTGTVNATMPDAGRTAVEPAGTSFPACRPTISISNDLSGSCSNAGADERLSPDKLIPAINQTGPKLGLIEELIYRWYIIPTLREGCWSGARGSFRCFASSRHGAPAELIPSILTS